MRGAIPPLPSTPSRRGVNKEQEQFHFLPFSSCYAVGHKICLSHINKLHIVDLGRFPFNFSGNRFTFPCILHRPHARGSDIVVSLC
jgi:hypothetical protein